MTDNSSKKNTNWDKEYLGSVKIELADFTSQGIKPTFRGMFYTLIDSYGLEKTAQNYKALNHASVRWREDGLIAPNAFADRTRHIVMDFNDKYKTPKEYVATGIEYLENAGEWYHIPKWYLQPNYMEIWIEKDAAVGTFHSIVVSEELEVVVAPCRGHSSFEFLRENVARLVRKIKEGKIVFVDYYGDMDPSGEKMDEIYKRKLRAMGLYGERIANNFKRMAVTTEQTQRFDLIKAELSEKDLEKMINDPNKEWFKKRHGLKSDRELFQIQLEAMQTRNVRAYLKKLIVDSVKDRFDDGIYEEVMSRKEHNPKAIMGLVRKEVKTLAKKL